MQEEITEMKYCLYARKSSEADERQALSTNSQIAEMHEKATREWIKISDVLIENHSAKDAWGREVFNKLLKQIEKWKFNGIITWAPDRLSRNAWDLGSLVDLMDNWKLLEIRTNGQNFTANPNDKFLLMILCSQAKLENDNKAINVIRWLKNKAKMGIRPGIPPLWYENKRSFVKNGWTIILDEKRWETVKDIFQKVGNEGYTGRQIQQYLDEIWFTTRKWKKVPLSMIYKMLGDTFYFWKFEYPKGTWNWYNGKHKPIITEALFEKVQKNLRLWRNYKKWNRQFDFTKILKCWNCGSSITAHRKVKQLKNWNLWEIVYYHCTRWKDLKCKEKCLPEELLVRQLVELVENINLKQIKISQTLAKEIERFNKFQALFDETKIKKKSTKNLKKSTKNWEKTNKEELGKFKKITQKQIKKSNIDIKNYFKYLLTEGTIFEKREVLSFIDWQIFIKNKMVYVGEVFEEDKK